MELLKKYIDCINAKNADKIEEIFSDTALFVDIPYTTLSDKSGKLIGSKEIKKFFQTLFSQEIKGKIIKLHADNKIMEYDITLNGTVLPCIGVIKEELAGKIHSLHIDIRN